LDTVSQSFRLCVNCVNSGPGGEQATEMAMNGDGGALVWRHTNVWAGSMLPGTYDNDGLHFCLNDPRIEARPDRLRGGR
jgi:hypothetical protein